MALTITSIDTVSPRGGSAGTPVVVIGGNFGIAVGSLVLDPLGIAIAAVATLWQPNRVEFLVPAGLPDNRTVPLLLTRQDGSDHADVPFWVPAQIPASNALDYQYPNFEEGSDQDTDNPREQSAADFNRMLDRVRSLEVRLSDPKDSVQAASTVNLVGVYNSSGGASGRGTLSGMPDTLDGVSLAQLDRVLLKDQADQTQNGIWIATQLGAGADGVWDRAPDFNSDELVTNGARTAVVAGVSGARTAWLLTTPDPVTVGGASGSVLTWELVAGGAGGSFTQVEHRPVPALGQTVFILPSTPLNSGDAAMYVGGWKYVNGVDFTVVGTTLTWLNTDFAFAATDSIEIIYLI